MKIHVRSSKRASPPQPEIAALVGTIAGTPQDELTDLLASYTSWIWPRSDLHAWIGVLNIFDGILENTVSSYTVDKLQTTPFTPEVKRQLLEILRFERLLLENSTNRKLYSSYDRLNVLLASSDLDVVVSVLQLLLRPAQQYSSQPAVAHVLNISSGRLESLSRRWSNLRDHGLELADLASPKKCDDVEQLPPAASDVKFTFYRRTSDSKDPEPESSASAAPPQTPVKKSSPAGHPSNANIVYLSSLATETREPMSILADAVEAHGIPESEHFELMCKIRAAWVLGKDRAADREKVVIIRILAIALYAHTQSESHAQSALFLYEPDLIAHLAELLQLDRDVSIAVQNTAIAALDGLVRYRSKMQEVLTAVNVGVNHGLLMALLRRAVVDASQPTSTVPSSFIEAILGFISYIASHASGGNMIVGAGLLPLLIQVIDNELPSRLSIVSKTMSLLDSVLYGFTNSFSIFCNARGVESLVQRIEHEVDLDVKDHDGKSEPRLAVARTNVLKHLLRSVHRMMQSPGTTEGLRGLIDSSLPKSLKKIFVHTNLFGPVVQPLAINIMSTFVHNEPTSLAIMQEQGLPEAFYSAIENGMDISIEILQAIPNAIGALCLNTVGQEQLTARPNIIPRLFMPFTSDKHVKILHEKENAMVMGSSIDELIRHHPNLKTAVFDAIIATLSRIEELGNAYVEPKGFETSYKLQLVPRPVEVEAPDEEMSQAIAMELGQPRPPTPVPATVPEPMPNGDFTHNGSVENEHVEYLTKHTDLFDNVIVSYVDAIGRFLEGLFQHTPHCRDFVTNTDGLERLGRLFTLPSMPYDFASTEYFLQVIRTIAEVAPVQTLQKLAQHVKTSLEETKDIWQGLGPKSKLLDWVAISTNNDLATANVKFRQLVTLNIRVTMLSEVYAATSMSHARSAGSALQNITTTDTAALIPLLGDLHRTFIWENILLKSAFPSPSSSTSMHSMEYGSVPTDLLPEGFLSSPAAQPNASVAVDEASIAQGGTGAATAKAEATKKQNISAIRQLTSQIPSSVTSFFQALIKMSLSGRRNVDSAHKKQATQIAKLLADVIVNHFAWRGGDDVSPLAVSVYHTLVLGFMSALLSGEPPTQSSLQTLLLITLWQVGAIQTFVDIAHNWVTTADGVMHMKFAERTDVQNQALVYSFGGLKAVLHILHTMTSSKPLFESAQTPLLITRDVAESDPRYFEPHDLLIKLRAIAIPLITRLWNDSWVSGPPLSITKSFVQNMLEIMRADKEDASMEGPLGSGIPPPSRVFASPVGPDENRIRQLSEMGFPRSAAERALIRTGNNVSAAAEYLLNHHPFPADREPEHEPEQDQEPEPEPEQDAERDHEVSVTSGDITGPSGEGSSNALPAAAVQTEDSLVKDNTESDAEMQDVESTSGTLDKGKGKEVDVVPAKSRQEWKEELDRARVGIRENLVQHAFKLVDEHPNLIFDIKAAFLGTASTSNNALKVILEDVKTFSPSAYDIHEQPLAVRLRLLGLVLTESASASNHLSHNEARDVMTVLLALVLSQEPSIDIAASPPKWLGALLLVAELLLGVSEEPPSVSIPDDTQEIEAKPLVTGPDFSDARMKLFDFALRLLQTQGLSRDDLLSALRLLVLLTRDYHLASEFVKRDGLSHLIKLFDDSPKTVTGLEVYVAILMRHAVEDANVLRVVMTQEIKRFFGQSRGRPVDMTSFMRGASHLVLRDPKAFVDATTSICALAGTNSQHIFLKPIVVTPHLPEDPTQTSVEMQVDEPVSATNASHTLETVVHVFISELMRVSRAALAYANNVSLPTIPQTSSDQSDPHRATEVAASASVSESVEIRAEGLHDFAYACFLMQCLTELLFSYEACKSAFLSYSRSKFATSSKEGKSRPAVLHFLLHDMISYGEFNGESATDQSRRRLLLCNWAASVVVALSVDVSTAHDLKDVSPELVAVRKTVIEAVSKAIKESTPSEPAAARYGRLMAMAELCYRLLTVKVQATSKSHDDVAIHTSKIMLEKGFVATLTNALAEVDLTFPNVKNLISAVLRPLEYLTRIAIKMGRTTDRLKAGHEKDDDEISTDMSEDVEDEDGDDNREATPDLYRNSALGMYGGEMEDVNYIDEDEDMDEDDDVIEEGAEYDDEPGSEHTSVTDSDEDDPDADELDLEAGGSEGWHDEDEEMEDEDGEDGDGEGTDDEGEDEDEEMVWEDVPDGDAVGGDAAEDLDDEDVEPVLPGMGDGADEDGDMGSEVDDAADDLSILEPADALQAVAEDPFAAHWLGALAGDPTARAGQGLFVPTFLPRRRGDIDAELQMFGRRQATHIQGPDVMTHPLLMDPATVISGPHSHRVRARAVRGVHQYNDLLAAVEEVVGGGAFQFLQQVIQRTRPGDTFQLELPAGAIAAQIERHPHRHARVVSAFPHRSGRHEHRAEHIELQPQPTSARWAEEIQITNGKSVPERVEKLSNHVVLALLPAARAKAKEDEEHAVRETAMHEAAAILSPAPDLPTTTTDAEIPSIVLQADEDTRPTTDTVMSDDIPSPSSSVPPVSDTQLVDAAATAIESISVNEETATTQAPSSAADADVSAENNRAEPDPAPEPGPSQQPARIIVTVNGTDVDITDTGIDPEFLEALPDDMREEVLTQHFRERGMAQQQIPADSQISAEFLEALPPEIRAELLHQESVERRRAQAAQVAASTAATNGPSDIDPASFLASLDPHLRQTVLLEQDDTFLQSLPSAMIAEAGAYRDAAHARRYVANLTGLGVPEPPSTSRRASAPRDAIQLLDRGGIATLVRLLYFPQVSKKSLLHKVLVNICENSKSRTELLNLLLGILHEGTGELLAVDKSFAQLSVRSSKTPVHPTPKATPKTKISSDVGSATQILAQLPSESIPNLVAQRSLEALSFVVSNNELSSLFFLSEQELPAGLRRVTSRKGKGKEKQATAVHYPVVALLGLLDRRLVLKTVSIMDSVAALLAVVTKPLTTLKRPDPPPARSDPIVLPTTESVTATSVPDQPSGSAPTSEEPVPAATAPAEVKTSTDSASLLSRPPTIPHAALRLIVNILTGGECSSRTFQHSLTLIQNLACLPDSRDTVASELRSRAQDLGTSIYNDLDDLVKQLQTAHTASAAATTIAVKFSPASSDQAKLLRVLKTIDYMYSSRSATDVATEERSQEDAHKLNSVYESFKFSSLWRRLGDVLAIVEEKPDVEHTATVLLPLIEALMVVCKNVGTASGRALRATSPRSPVTPRESMEELFVNFTDAHRKVLNLMVRNNPSLMSGSFSLLVHNPRVLDFDNKRNYFNQQLHRRPSNREHHGTLQLNVRRARVFEDSFQNLQRRTGEQIKYGKLSVRFYDEEGVDAGGVTREWFQILARQMFNPDYCLFQPCAADKLTYQPNRASAVNPEHLSFFKFVGRIIGKAIYDGRLLDAYFARSLYRQLLGKPVDYRDVEWVDPSYYNSLCWLLENDPSPLDMTFSIEAAEFGVTEVIPLKENGASIPVTLENRREFVQLAAEHRLYSSIKDQIESLLSGFYEIIPKDQIAIFNEQEVELLISGTPDIDVDEWRAATEYNGYTASDPVIVWWWRALKSFSRDERAKVLSFATGTSRVPLGGFVDLQGVQGVQRFSIHKAYGGTDRLPQAHTCFNQVDLPQYSSYEMLRTQLLLAINEGGEGFGFA